MKSLVVGAMLLRTMNAQLAPAISTGTAANTDTAASTDTAAAASFSAAVSLAVAASLTALSSATNPSVLSSQAPTVVSTGTLGTVALPSDLGIPTDAAAPVDTVLTDSTSLPVPTVTTTVALSTTAPADTTLNPISSSAIVDASPVQTTSSTDVTSTPLPVGAALPIGINPYDPNSPYYNPYAQPPGWQGEDNGIYDGEDDDAYQGAQAPGKNPGHDYNNANDDAYQGAQAPGKNPGHDYNDDEECPAWCLPEDDSYDSYPTSTPAYDYSPYQPTPTPGYADYAPVADSTPSYEDAPYPAPSSTYGAQPQYYPEPDQSYPQLKKARSIPRAVRRQALNWPQSAYAQPAYSDDDDSGSYDGEDGSIPDWLYDISGAPMRPTPTPTPKPQPKCPESCYKPKSTNYGYGTRPARPTYTMTRKGGYQTTELPYYPEPTNEYSPVETTNAPYAEYTSNVWYPPSNSSAGPTNVYDEATPAPYESTPAPYEPTAAPYEPTAAPYEPTTLATQYQPATYAQQTGGAGSDPGSPAGDYTGDTLDTICPNTCNPFNPAENLCDTTTGCATTGGSKYYCACRAGFRADNYNAKDFSKQFKVAGQPYVYLAVSTSCNTPCSDQTCSEVLERSQCK